jgi:hypothetical protein
MRFLGGHQFLIMSDNSDLDQRISSLEATVSNLETCNRGNVTAVMRIKAQASAIYSLLAEIAQEHGFAPEVISAHLRTRSNYYLDRMLADAEKENPHLGAVLDDRLPDEVPAVDGYPPLFVREG